MTDDIRAGVFAAMSDSSFVAFWVFTAKIPATRDLWYKRGLLKRAAAAAEGPASVDQWKTSHLMTVRFRVTQARWRQGKSDSHIFFANGEVQWGELHGTACFNPQSVDFQNVSLHPPSSRELFFSGELK